MIIQRACDRCTQGVVDADGPSGPGNDHLHGRCSCRCHRAAYLTPISDRHAREAQEEADGSEYAITGSML